MLRRLEVPGSYRSLCADSWPRDLFFGKRTVVYGHNGSGKSSLASLLFELSSDEGVSAAVNWEDHEGNVRSIPIGGRSPADEIAVFTKEWVKRNLSAFLEGDHASPIVTLGEKAIASKERELTLMGEVEALDLAIGSWKETRKSLVSAGRKVATDVQSAIADELRDFDYQRFSKNRFSLPVVEGRLREAPDDYPDQAAHVAALTRLGEGSPRSVRPVAPPGVDHMGWIPDLEELLAQIPSRVALESLAADRERQTWVERGVRLHEGLGVCLYCASEIRPSRREELARHFDESWLRIRELSDSMLVKVIRDLTTLNAWRAALPPILELAGDLQAEYAVSRTAVDAEVAARVAILEEVRRALDLKVEDPSSIPSAPDCEPLTAPILVETIGEIIERQNALASDHAKVVEKHYQTILNHLIGSQAGAFRGHEAQLALAEASLAELESQMTSVTDELLKVRQERFSNSKMAEILTKDLDRVYGKGHLSVVVTDDNKSYIPMRGGEPATHLSEGERTTLSLLYFLRALEDERVSTDKASRIVVIDDPSSSLDREALFATHEWLRDTLREFGQFIVLTHDFGLLRLLLKSQKNAWNGSRRKISSGDADEIRFPTVSYLEVYAANNDGARFSRMKPLPAVVWKHTTEYTYLFNKVMDGVAKGPDDDGLYLLPNAARRLLEVFTSYKTPHLANLDQRLEALMGPARENPYRDVYDFCNRYSHGEGSESVEDLDALVVHRQLRRCMEFLKASDQEHFERMCTATECDAALIA